MTQLQNAPVAYVIAALRFAPLVDAQPLAAALQPRLRDDFPHYEDFAAPHLNVNIEHDTVSFSHEEIRTFTFSAADRTIALMVNAGQISLHTRAYRNNAHFIDLFGRCVEAAIGVPDVGIRLVHGIGLRYVDLIVPRDGERLEDYLVAGFLPTDIEAAGLKVRDGVYAAGYDTKQGILRVQSFRRPPTVLPLELNTEFTQREGWAAERPEEDFAVLDVDHGWSQSEPVEIGAVNVRDRLHELHGPIRAVFDAFATTHAMAVWKGEK